MFVKSSAHTNTSTVFTKLSPNATYITKIDLKQKKREKETPEVKLDLHVRLDQHSQNTFCCPLACD